MSQSHVKQVGGDHYEAPYQHWDLVGDCHISYFEANATKYVGRWRKKNGIQDLQKGISYLEKRIALLEANGDKPEDFINRAYRDFTVSYMWMLKWFDAAGIEPIERHICALIFNWETKEHLQEAIKLINGLITVAKAEENAYIDQ